MVEVEVGKEFGQYYLYDNLLSLLLVENCGIRKKSLSKYYCARKNSKIQGFICTFNLASRKNLVNVFKRILHLNSSVAVIELLTWRL